MTGKDLVPLITLPTRFAKKTCSLIDHIWVIKPSKGALEPARTTSWVFLKKNAKADHLPCISTLDILEAKLITPKFVNSQKIDDNSIAAFRQSLIESDIINSIDPNNDGNVEETYTIIQDTLTTLKEQHFPINKVKFKCHEHKIQPWMTDIILLNIKLKDETYVKFRKAKSNLDKIRLKAQLKEMEKDLTDWINEAKTNYYTQQFDKYKNDIKKTWDTIKMAIDRRRHKSCFPDYFKVNERDFWKNRNSKWI